MTEPNPGSPEAIKQGCMCPAIDNHYGEGFVTGTGRHWVRHEACPLHGAGVNSWDTARASTRGEGE